MKVDKAAALLGVRVDDGEQTIRAAYRRLAIKWHPDKCKDARPGAAPVPREEATKKFQEINQAFQALSHWKETGTDLDSGDEVRARGDRGADGFMDLAEMMMCAPPRSPPPPSPSHPPPRFFEFMMGGARGGGGGANGARGGPAARAPPARAVVDADMMFDFAFGGGAAAARVDGAPAHWGAMDDDYDDDDGESGESGESDDECATRATTARRARWRRAARARAVPSGEPGALSVGELKALLRDRDVDFSGCLEKSEMLHLLLDWEARHGGGGKAEADARATRTPKLQREWNSSQRRAAVQQTKQREVEARREAELQRASATAAAVALSGLPGFEDLIGARRISARGRRRRRAPRRLGDFPSMGGDAYGYGVGAGLGDDDYGYAAAGPLPSRAGVGRGRRAPRRQRARASSLQGAAAEFRPGAAAAPPPAAREPAAAAPARSGAPGRRAARPPAAGFGARAGDLDLGGGGGLGLGAPEFVPGAFRADDAGDADGAGWGGAGPFGRQAGRAFGAGFGAQPADDGDDGEGDDDALGLEAALGSLVSGDS
ncbi:hypothetical protein SO694_000671112 [Aureococcus anophagefferens]|uniref:J domain-containing protein n=1 Tax=Aureococcus anophagefferens TaxID=44056 RepID=A0ABR1FQI8_AURAN